MAEIPAEIPPEIPPVTIVSQGTRDIVGESPVWDARTGRIHWVDIIGKRVRSLDLDTGDQSEIATADFPTAIGLCRDAARLVVAFASGVALLDLTSGAVTPFAMLDEDPAGNRLNEGAVGPDGAFWVGTMQTNLKPDGTMRDMDRSSGALYRVGPDQSVRRVTAHAFGISNTLAWDTERGRLYFGDTLRQTIFALPWPMTDGQPPLADHAHSAEDGYPDGSTLDTKGRLWTARYAAGCLHCYGVDGALETRIPMPATNITACTFGGPAHSTLYVTTAANQLGAAALEDPHQGALLAIDVKTRGAAPFLFGG